VLAVWFFRSEGGRDESTFPSAASVAEREHRPSSTDDATAVNVEAKEREDAVRPSSTGEKTFANWSTYHSKQGGFSVYLPDQREEKQHVQIEGLGLDGRAVQAQFVQLPNADEPIESWPAIGEVWLRAMWVERSDRESSPRGALVRAGATAKTVVVGDLPGKEFVMKRGNETQKARLFVNGDQTILLTATFVGRESGGDGGLPFGERVDRFLSSLRLDSGDGPKD
jgi:hypothetical protein